MIRVAGSVVDTKLNLIGLSIEGSAADFGLIGTSTALLTKRVYLADLAKSNFKTSMLSVSMVNGAPKIVYNEKSTMKLRDLPMLMLTENELVPFNNKATVETVRYNKSAVPANTIGYVININGKHLSVKKDDILAISELFELDFKVATDSKGNSYIVGKAGGRKKEDLNIEIVGAPVKKAKIKDETNLDLVTLIGAAKACNATLLINTSKLHVSDMLVKTSAIAEPNLKFTAKSLNVNLTSKLYGRFVSDDKVYPVQAYKTINVAKNGRICLDEIKVVIEKKYLHNFVKAVGASTVMADCTSELKKPDLDVLKTKFSESIIALKIKLDGMHIINPSLAQKFIKTAKEIDSIVEKLNSARICKTILKDEGLILEIAPELKGEIEKAKKGYTLSVIAEILRNNKLDRKDVHPTFKNETTSKLMSLVEDGVNICTGFYEPSGYRSSKENDIIEIEYTNKYSKLAGPAKILDAISKGDTDCLPSSVNTLLGIVSVHKRKGNIAETVENLVKDCELMMEEQTEVLAKHKIAMCEASGFDGIHSNDMDEWETFTKYRGQGTKYISKTSRNELACVCKNIAIK